MKKLSIYIAAMLMVGLTSCSKGDFFVSGTQTNEQESVLKSTDITYDAVQLNSINLGQLIVEDKPIALGTVTVTEGAMPKNTVLVSKIDIAKAADFSDAVTVEGESMEEVTDVSILPSKLHSAYINNFTQDPNPTTIYMRFRLFTITDGTSEAIVGEPGNNYYGNFTIAFTPYDEKGLYISTGYYALVMGLDGKWTETKFAHSDIDVYDDPVFTVTIDAIKNAASVRQDTKFLVVAEEDLEAFKAGDTSVAFGKGEGDNIVKGGPAFVGPASDGAAKYDITLNMEIPAIGIEPVIIYHCYYLLTNSVFNMKIEAPEEYRCYMFYKTSETTFTYTTFWPNNVNGTSQFNVKVWEREAMLANATSNSWGFNGGSKDARVESGDFKKAGGWLGPVTEGWYTFTITMDEENNIHKYQWTAVQETEKYNQISIVGANGEKDLTQCKVAPHNWYLLDYEVTAETKVKFRANHTDTKVWGGDGSQPISQTVYTLPAGSQEITVPAGTYDIFLNDITGNWTILKTNK